MRHPRDRGAYRAHTVGASLTTAPQTLQTVRVMAIGGSIAHGWDDTPSLGGYLARTFRSLSRNRTTYVFTNESSEGKGPSYYVTRMNELLTKDKPNLVVISFGMLNDLFDHHPMSKMNQDVVEEVRDALAHNAQVVLITPRWSVPRTSNSRIKKVRLLLLKSAL
ncbi:hypothetical protein GCM10025858_27960 [Alicyclobacillus sacchari]|nr:hypothetical protein GCM10025858_27960 [Alicyclobacillus sacchari]